MSREREQFTLGNVGDIISDAIESARTQGASDETKIVFVAHGLHPAGRVMGYYYNNIEDSLEILVEP